jgi:SAM-dependent methyltransferase
MKRCIECNRLYIGEQCPDCHHIPADILGFPAYAPDLAMENDGFDPSAHEGLEKIEDTHFWFENRNRLIIWALRKYFSTSSAFCEIGCGTGYVLHAVNDAFPKLRMCGSELYSTALSTAHARVAKAELFQADICDFPFVSEYDLIGVFDVLEHITRDELALSNIYRALKPGGGIIITVPQHR